MAARKTKAKAAGAANVQPVPEVQESATARDKLSNRVSDLRAIVTLAYAAVLDGEMENVTGALSLAVAELEALERDMDSGGSHEQA